MDTGESEIETETAHDPERIDRAILIVLGTSVVFWPAHVYSLWLSSRTLLRRSIRRDEVVCLALAGWPMLQSCWPIAAAFGFAVLGLKVIVHPFTGGRVGAGHDLVTIAPRTHRAGPFAPTVGT